MVINCIIVNYMQKWSGSIKITLQNFIEKN